MSPVTHSPTCPPLTATSVFFIPQNLLAFTPIPDMKPVCHLRCFKSSVYVASLPKLPSPFPSASSSLCWHCFPCGCPISLSHGPFSEPFSQHLLPEHYFLKANLVLVQWLPFSYRGNKYRNKTCRNTDGSLRFCHWFVPKTLSQTPSTCLPHSCFPC